MFEQLNGTYKLQENDTALKYSDNPKKLKETLSEIAITIRVVGKDFYFDEDKEERIILRVFVERGKEKISFRYGMSTRDTEILSVHSWEELKPLSFPFYTHGNGNLSSERKRIKGNLLYDILTCIRSEYHCPDTFENFCGEFGYDTDSRKAEKIFHALQEQSKKLSQIFTEKEIESFPS